MMPRSFLIKRIDEEEMLVDVVGEEATTSPIICSFRGLDTTIPKKRTNFSIDDIMKGSHCTTHQPSFSSSCCKSTTHSCDTTHRSSPYTRQTSCDETFDEIVPSPPSSVSSLEEDADRAKVNFFFPKLMMQKTEAFTDSERMRRHQCEVCFKWFQRTSSLSNHRLIHRNEKTFKCEHCGNCFLRKSDLEKHSNIHSGVKPYACQVCGKRFSQSSNMLTHQRRHTGIRPYACNFCGKCFYRKVDVRRHAAIHK